MIQSDGGVVRVKVMPFSTLAISVVVKLDSFLPIIEPIMRRYFENMLKVTIVDFIRVRIHN